MSCPGPTATHAALPALRRIFESRNCSEILPILQYVEVSGSENTGTLHPRPPPTRSAPALHTQSRRGALLNVNDLVRARETLFDALAALDLDVLQDLLCFLELHVHVSRERGREGGAASPPSRSPR